ncbi:hypothetical protein AB0D46_02120 [Streptomyces sp. NPDC048383]|uniref:hypothetical protein n=1 Tax=Streptomyces sp. NPDC048383 TaxID=3155386 RepID=UPI00342D6237
MRSTRRSTLRTAAVLTGAAAVLAVPVGSAFADSATAPGAEALSGIERPAVDPTAPPPVTPPVTPPVVPPVTQSTTPPVAARGYVTTVKLADGSVAKVYRVGDDRFEAEIFAGGRKAGSLAAENGRSTNATCGGLHITLHGNGRVTSWVEGGGKPVQKPVEKPVEKSVVKPRPNVKKETRIRVTLPDGRIARLVDGHGHASGPQGKRVELFTPHGRPLGTIDLKHPNALHDGWTYKLVQDGKRLKFVAIDGRSGGDSWVYDFGTGKLIETYTVEKAKPGTPADVVTAPTPTTAPVVKPAGTTSSERTASKDGARVGAEGVAHKGDTPALVAAGGGMAAMGAASLGFAMLRRGRGRG